jgi:hypothetical protein
VRPKTVLIWQSYGVETVTDVFNFASDTTVFTLYPPPLNLFNAKED